MISVNGVVIDKFKNEEHVYKEFSVETENNILLQYENDGDLFALQTVMLRIKNIMKDAKNILYLPYIPYSRMDRKIDDQVFMLEEISRFLNCWNFEKIVSFDPHSKVSENIISNLEIYDINNPVNWAIELFDPAYLFFPDKGARTKYTEKLTNGLPYFYGEKTRDTHNKGKITGYELFTNGLDINGKRILIVDDLCVTGWTFKFAADSLIKNGASAVGLYISHCEPAIYEGPLGTTDRLSGFYTTNSMIRSQNFGLQVYDVVKRMEEC